MSLLTTQLTKPNLLVLVLSAGNVLGVTCMMDWNQSAYRKDNITWEYPFASTTKSLTDKKEVYKKVFDKTEYGV